MIVQPTRIYLRTCTIAGIPHEQPDGAGGVFTNFVVHSFRVYEDICKAYFTGQLVIEDQVNRTDPYLYPAAEVVLSWLAEPIGQIYTERFRVYSIESTPKKDDVFAGMTITVNLIGDEYFNDTQNTVMLNIANQTATAAASQIHQQYISENGGLQVSPSLGMIGQQNHPHQVMNMKPIKAIHDLLDKAVSAAYKTSAFVYFRNKPGYVIAPLEQLLETTPIIGRFVHEPAQATDMNAILAGYDRIIHLRPMAPPSQETAAGARSAELDSLMKTASFFDMKTGNFVNRAALTGIGGIGTTFNALKQLQKNEYLKNAAQGMLGKAVKSQFGARLIFNAINEDRQPRQVDKAGPGGYNTAEEAFIAALAFSKKYWISVPMQTGLNITIGNRINVLYPVGARQQLQAKTLFVARLVHEGQFKTPAKRGYEPSQGTTEMYCIEW